MQQLIGITAPLTNTTLAVDSYSNISSNKQIKMCRNSSDWALPRVPAAVLEEFWYPGHFKKKKNLHQVQVRAF